MLCFCFRFPWGLHISCSNSPVPWGSTQPVTGREGTWAPSPVDREGTEAPLGLGCHFVSSSAQVRHSCAQETFKCHTLTLGKIPFLTSHLYDLQLPAPSGIFNRLLSPGSLLSPRCRRMLEMAGPRKHQCGETGMRRGRGTEAQTAKQLGLACFRI